MKNKILSILIFSVLVFGILGMVSALPATTTFGPTGPNQANCKMDGSDSDYDCTTQVKYDDNLYADMDTDEEVQSQWTWSSSGIPTNAVVTDAKVRVLARETNSEVTANIQLWSTSTEQSLTGYQSLPYNSWSTLTFQASALTNEIQSRISAGQDIRLEVDVEGSLFNNVQIDYVSVEITYYINDTTAPVISVSQTPEYPTCGSSIRVCANVTDQSPISFVNMVCSSGIVSVTKTGIVGTAGIYCAEFSSGTMEAADANNFVCTVNAQDNLGNAAQSGPTTLVTYDCADPVARTTGTYNCNEGSTITLDGSTSSDSVDTALSYSWAGVNSGSDTATPTFNCVDDSVNTVTLTVTDNVGRTNTVTTTVTVNNVAPVAEANGVYNVNEGSSVELSGSATDVAADTLSYAWNLDGEGYETLTQNTTFTCLQDGTYTVGLQVTDDNGGIGTDTATINCANVAPAIGTTSVISPINEEETTTFNASVSDVGADDTSFNYTIAWGDGSTDTTGVTTGAISATHQYMDNAAYTITLTVTDSDGATDVETKSMTVLNKNPWNLSIAKSTTVTLVGQSISFTGSANDVAADTLSYAWNFGDNHTATGASATNSYAVRGTYTVTMTVTDDDGGSSTTSTTVTIYDYSIALAKDWNLISIPLVPTNDDTSIDNVLGGVANNADVIWSFTPNTESGRNVWNYNEADEGAWSNELSRIQNIVPGYGYYLKMLASAVAYENGDKMYGQGERSSPPVVQLATGWNLIGHYGMNSGVSKANALDAFSGTYSTLLDEDGNPQSTMSPKLGYWLFVKSINTGEYAPSETNYGQEAN